MIKRIGEYTQREVDIERLRFSLAKGFVLDGIKIYEGSSEIHQLIQAGYALGYREDTPLRCELPAYTPKDWQ